MNKPKKDGRLFIADTVALIIYSVYTGTFSLAYEVYYSDSTFWQWAGIRFFYVILKYGLAHYYCAKLTYFVRKIFQGNPEHWFRRGIADSLSISIYQQSLYIPSALVVGADMIVTISAAGLYFAENMLLGWIYGLLLNWCRRKIANQK